MAQTQGWECGHDQTLDIANLTQYWRLKSHLTEITDMENALPDWVLGGLALVILIGGLLMLFSGVGSMGNKP
jgi:hypothetical protein